MSDKDIMAFIREKLQKNDGRMESAILFTQVMQQVKDVPVIERVLDKMIEEKQIIYDGAFTRLL